MPKTLAEIAIDAGLVDRANATRAGRLAEQRQQPLVVTLIRELGIDELALLGALRKQTRVPLVDPAAIQVDSEALRQVPRDVCARLRVLPVAVASDPGGKVLRLAMADPTDTAAVAELEQLTQCDIEVCALPLSAIEELVDKGYRQFTTAVIDRPGVGGTMFITSKGSIPRTGSVEAESEVSVTAQIPIAALQHAVGTDDLEARLAALVQVLVAKGLITEAELAEALRAVLARPKPPTGSDS